MTTHAREAALVGRLQRQVLIEAPKERVWQALVHEADSWFVGEGGPGPADKTFRVEARVGGLMYEDWGDGNGLLWGHVILCNAPEALHVAGDCSPQWGGPNRGIMIWELSEAEGVTTLKFEHALYGNVSDETCASYDGGWKIQLEQGLKGYIESGAS